MQRMRHLLAPLGLSFLVAALMTPMAGAALLHPTDTSQFPDISAGFVSGTQQYSAQTGQFVVNNTPYALALGPTAASQYDVTAGSDGQRSQTIVAQIDSTGNLVSSGTNLYELYGTVTVNGQTYSGLLLKGTPTSFGSLNLAAAPTNIAGAAMYDLDIKITDGLLKQAFGTDAYIRLTAERWSTFDGSFAHDFSGGKVASNIRGFMPSPAPVPEPTTLVVLVACGGAGLLFRHRRSITLAELGAKGR